MNDSKQSAMAQGPCVLHAPAKVNLWLKIHGKREDGYHELSTLMLALELGDELRGQRMESEGIQLEVVGPYASPDIPSDERNLVWKALDAVRRLAQQSFTGPLPGVRVTLHKNVPSQAGLGGGSSDAATAVTLGEKLWGVDGGDAWRQDVLASLGADCSFFQGVQESALAMCEGAGEKVSAWPGSTPTWWVGILVPDAVCPTGTIFAALSDDHRVQGECPFHSAPQLAQMSLEQVRGALATDLEAPALRAVPELQRWRALCDEHGAQHLRLSGSGSAFFGLYADAESAQIEIERLAAAGAAQGLCLRGKFITRARQPSS